MLTLSALLDKGVKYSGEEGFKKVNNILTFHLDPDIIAFGSSVGEKSFNSNIVSSATGVSVYNCCVDGTNFEQYKGLVESYNLYSSRKSLVLFFDSYFSLQQLPVISSIERFAAYLDNKSIYENLYAIDPSVTWRSKYIPLYKNTVVDHTYYKAALTGWKNILLRRTGTDSLRGFVPSYLGWEADEDAAFAALRPFTIPIDKKAISDYINMIVQLERKGKQVIIIFPPIYEKLYKEKADFRELHSTLDSVSAITGCGFMDFSTSFLSRDKKFFYNTNHLNFTGAAVFSEMLADSLRKYRITNGYNIPIKR